MAKLNQRQFEAHCFRQPIPKRRRKEVLNRREDLLAVVWGLERFRFHLLGKQVQLFPNHQALEPLLKKNKTKQRPPKTMARSNKSLRHNIKTYCR